jgi:hypothetical protein
LGKIRERSILKEDTNQNEQLDAIAITNDPKFGQEVLKNQIEEFRATVDGGAQFANENSASPTESPLVYIPSKDNLVFSGTIPALNNLKWQFSLRDSDGTGLFIQTPEKPMSSSNPGDEYTGLRLNKENLQILNKLYGHYQNWKKEWEASSGMLVNLKK